MKKFNDINHPEGRFEIHPNVLFRDRFLPKYSGSAPSVLQFALTCYTNFIISL